MLQQPLFRPQHTLERGGTSSASKTHKNLPKIQFLISIQKVSIKSIGMELYGIKLHILCSITGGFILRRNDKWPNIIKGVTLAVLFAFFYLILSLELKLLIRILLSAVIAVLVLILELIVIWFNSLLDESVALSSSSGEEEEEENVIPPGISGPLWEARSVLFNDTIPLDDRAYQLVRRGFDVDEVFRLIALIHEGRVTRDTKDRAPVRRVKTNLIVLCGQVINVRFDRESLARTFTRPRNNWHLVSSVVLTFLLAGFVPETQSLNSPAWVWYLALICALSIFSLLLPPPTDPYATSLYDPFIGYTRAASAVGMTGVVTLMHVLMAYLPEETYVPQLEFTVVWNPILVFIEQFGYYLFMFFPFMILFGLLGHSVTTLHWMVETTNKYLFGISGSSSFKKSVMDFLWSGLIVVAISVFMLIGNHPVTVGVSILVVTFFIQFSISDNCQTFMKKHLVTAIVASAISGATALLNWVIKDNIMWILLYVIAFIHFIIDILFPYMSTHQSYFFFYGRIIPINFLTRYTHFITNFVTAPAFISFAIVQDDDFQTIVSALVIFHGLRVAQTLPFIFCIAILLNMVFFPYDLGLNPSSVSLLVSLMLTRKLTKVLRYARLFAKHKKLPVALYEDPQLNPLRYIRSIVMSYAICFTVHPLAGISFPAFVWSVVTGAPMSIFLGYEMLYVLSPPRPNSFYDYVPESKQHDEYMKNASDHPLEAPIYLSLAGALERNIGRLVKDGELGLLTDDTFFLMISGDFTAIVHIIAIEANKVSFQVRGLEYVQQTLCHGGEMSILQKIITEHRTIGNFGHAVAFAFSMFQLRVLGLELEMLDLAQFDLTETVLPAIGRGVLGWELKALVFGVLKVFSVEGTDPPEGVALDDITPKFSGGHITMIQYFAAQFNIEATPRILQRLWNIIHFIHTVIVNKQGKFNQEKMYELFEGRCEIDENVKPEESILHSAFRYSIAVLLMVSVQLAPTSNEPGELFEFLQEVDDTYRCLPLKSSEIENVLKDGSFVTLSMIATQDAVSIVRLSQTTTKWSIFQMDSECIRGFWANEAKSILFFAMSSRERNSIQGSIQSLRNITNQSCNQPIGYPAYVTNVIDSYTDKD